MVESCDGSLEETAFLSSSSSSDELLSDSSDAVLERFDGSEIFDFEGEGDLDGELDCDEDEED